MSQELVATVLAGLANRGETVAVAESLTGGELTALLTAPVGASQVVLGGLVVYATESKVTLAGVDPAVLERVGPVDPLVATQLAAGARTAFGATYGIGVTGVAGPDEQAGRPVGELHIAVAGSGGSRVESHQWGAARGRSAIRRAAAERAVALLAEVSREAGR